MTAELECFGQICKLVFVIYAYSIDKYKQKMCFFLNCEVFLFYTIGALSNGVGLGYLVRQEWLRNLSAAEFAM